jgi:hypothetical protein
MKGVSPRWTRLFRVAAFALLGALVMASLPFLFDLMSRGRTWAADHLPKFQKHWEEPLWLR